METSQPTDAGRIRPDDDLIDTAATCVIMGGVSVSTAYSDAELMALKVKIGPPGERGRVRFIRREVLELRAERVARCDANAAAIRAQVEEQRARRSAKRRMQAAGQSPSEITPET